MACWIGGHGRGPRVPRRGESDAQASHRLPIGGPSPVELLAAGIENKIRDGHIAPGTLIDLARIAEKSEVNLASPRLCLGAAQRDGLVTLRGDLATVAPLDLAELRGTYRLLRTIETDLIARTSQLISSTELDQLEAQLTGGIIAQSDDHDTTAQAVGDLFTQLCRPAESRPELLTYIDTRRVLSRYLRLGFDALEADESRSTSCEREDDNRDALCREIVTTCERRQVRPVTNAVQEFRRRAQQVAELAFELYPARPTPRAL